MRSAPELSVGILDAIEAGDVGRAVALQDQLALLRSAFDLGTFPVVVKEALAMVGTPVGPCRRPVGPLSEEARGRLRGVLVTLGHLSA